MDGSPILTLTLEEIKDITVFDIDHPFPAYKEEAGQFGYRVHKISMEKKYVAFHQLGWINLHYGPLVL
jgi:hypothetical protein